MIGKNTVLRVFEGQALHPHREGGFPEKRQIALCIRYGVVNSVTIHIVWSAFTSDRSPGQRSLGPWNHLYLNGLAVSMTRLPVQMTVPHRKALATRAVVEKQPARAARLMALINRSAAYYRQIDL